MKINKWLYMSAALLVLAGCNDDWNEDKLEIGRASCRERV